jgi:peptidoglycan/xylan/chitin deacetylase (PgdA/CDA1 family)
MDRQKLYEQLINGVNVLILLVVMLIYVVTGTRAGDDAISALGASRTVYAGRANGDVALECVVSWDAAAVKEILDTLKKEDVRITFFVSGKWAKNHASTLKAMAEAGHEIGTCGFSPTLDGGVSVIKRDVAAAASTIQSITGTPVRYYYSGLRDRDVSARAAESLEMIHVSATADLLSARGTGADLVERALGQGFDGSILMIQPTAAAKEALPALLDAIAQKGWGITTVGGVMKGST